MKINSGKEVILLSKIPLRGFKVKESHYIQFF